MKNRDLLSSLFWLAFGIIFVSGGVLHGLMEAEGVPGRGALPFIAGVFAIILSLMVLIPSIFKRGDVGAEGPKSFFPERSSWKRLFIAIILMVSYGFILKTLGYPLTTFFFLIGALRLIEPQRWRITIVFSLFTTAISYSMFKILEVNLPRGILGF